MNSLPQFVESGRCKKFTDMDFLSLDAIDAMTDGEAKSLVFPEAKPTSQHFDLLIRHLRPELADPTADLCIHAFGDECLFAHSSVIREKWPQLLSRSKPVDASNCRQQLPFAVRHITRTHLQVHAKAVEVKYLLDLVYGRPDEPQNEHFYNRIEQFLDAFPINSSNLIFTKYFLNQFERTLKDDDLILRYGVCVERDENRAAEIRQEVTYRLYQLIRAESLALIHFARLKLCTVIDLLTCSSLNVAREVQVLELVLLYIDQKTDDYAERLNLAKMLVPCVKYMRDGFQDKAPELIATQELTVANMGDFINTKEPTPRMPRDLLLVYGGWLDKPSRMSQVFARHANKFTEMDWLSDGAAIAYHVLSLYLIGGYNGIDYLRKVRKLRDGGARWEDMPSMQVGRCYAAGCSDGRRYIYVCGGFNGRTRLRTVERFDIDKGVWQKMPSMRHHRSDAAAAYWKEKVVVAGGFNGEAVMPFVEIFDEKAKLWTEVWNMNSPRSGLCLVPFEDKLVALGGYTSGEISDAVEYLFDTHGTWRDGPKLRVKRSNFTAVVYDGDLVVLGGHDGSSTLRTVEVWRKGRAEFEFGPELTVRCSAVKTCVLRDWKSMAFVGDHLVSSTLEPSKHVEPEGEPAAGVQRIQQLGDEPMQAEIPPRADPE